MRRSLVAARQRGTMVAMLLGLLVLHGRPVLAQDAAARWEALNNRVVEANQRGTPGQGVPLAQEALGIARQAFGDKDPRTLLSLGNLAALLHDQGRLGEAEPLYREALQALRETLGPRHPSTLLSLNNLATLLQDQGRLGDAEPLAHEALQVKREVLGARHPSTLLSLSNLAALLHDQGRLGDAEPLLREALQAQREVLGPRHSSTLRSMNNLAALLHDQGRLGDAEPLYREALQTSREVLGPRHPNTLLSLNNLGMLLQDQGRLGEAEPLLREALETAQDPTVQGPRHPNTLTSMNNLGVLLQLQGRLSEAEALLREALQAARDPAVLGPAHPSTLLFQLNLVRLLAAQGRVLEAVRQQQAMEPQVLAWLGAELFSTEAATVRQGLVASQATYQDFALSLALLPDAPREAAELAASAVLRFKGLATEEEAYLASIVRRGEDAHVRALAADVASLHARLARLFQAGGGPEANALAQELDRKELELGRKSRAYKQTLRVREASLQDLRGVLAGLPARGALLEMRQYRPMDFKAGQRGEPRWAGVLVTAEGGIQVRDLGSVAEGTRAVQQLLQAGPGPGAEQAASALHAQLLQPFAAELAGVERLYVAPDGALYLVNVAALRGANGRPLLEATDVRLVQTGRDLLRPAADRPARGLVALGGITFDLRPSTQTASAIRGAAPSRLSARAGREPASPSGVARTALNRPATPTPLQVAAASPVPGRGAELEQLRQRAADTLRGGFAPLPGTKEEVEAIAGAYLRSRRDEPQPLLLEGKDASKARLLALAAPPRVLHLATHGFYWAKERPADRPMLLAGVALAGANQALAGAGQDGILYAIEAQDLNLEGTELVVLSACNTAQGQVDYGEGVSGLVRALRTAGARNVLVSLRAVPDQGTAAFMQRFYHHWLAQGRSSDPAAALRATQQEQLHPNADPTTHATPDQTWTSFILVGG